MCSWKGTKPSFLRKTWHIGLISGKMRRRVLPVLNERNRYNVDGKNHQSSDLFKATADTLSDSPFNFMLYSIIFIYAQTTGCLVYKNMIDAWTIYDLIDPNIMLERTIIDLVYSSGRPFYRHTVVNYAKNVFKTIHCVATRQNCICLSIF